MAHFALLWKARTVEKYRLKYENEKINSIAMADIELPKKTVLQKWRHYRFDTQKRISKTFRQLYPEGSSVSNFIVYLRTKQTFTNALTKAVFGFVAGYVLSYLCFIFFVYQLSISVIYATVLSFIIGILLTVGLAFSHRVRCLVFLLIPQFFSRVGRYTLTCYALILILTGPATNTLKNSEVLSESMACSQEQIKTNINNLEESMKNPHNFLKDSVNQMAYTTKKISLKIKEVMIKINRLLLSVVSAIQMNFAWLKSIASGCNLKLGTPHQHCTEVLKKSVKYCERVLGAIPRFCDVTYLTRASCDGTKAFDAFCGVSEFVDGCILATVKRRLREFSDRVKAMMYVEVYIHHSYLFSANVSHSDSQVASGIVTEIRNRADPLLTWLSWSSCVTSLFLLLIIFRAKYYQHMYETRSRFDNRYVTKELRDIDLKRMREGRETILPLNRREKAKYINITSFRLLASERTYLSRSVVFMTITTFKLLIHMVADYSLYWVLMTIKYHGSLQTSLHAELPKPVFNVSGHGFVTRLVRSILNVLNIPLIETESSMSCLPNPHLPDFRRYMQIGLLIFMLWFFALFEPYGLRMRHVIMSHYRPERARERAMWLYNHILRTRGSFIKFARRKLHREYKYKTETQSTFRMCLNIYLPFNFLRSLIGIGCEEMECLLCGTTPSKADFDTQLIRCKSKDCPGTYCSSCFTEIGQLCTVCLYPEDYGDISDVSLEKGSSEESDNSDDDNNESRNLIRDSNKNESLTKHSSGEDSTNKDRRMKKYWTLFPKAKKYDEVNFPLLPYTSHMMKKRQKENSFISNNNYCNKAENHFETLLLDEVFKISSTDSAEVFFPNKTNIINGVTKTLLLPATLQLMSTLPQNQKCFEMKINVFYIREKSYCLKFGKRYQLRKVNIRSSIDTILKYVPTNRNSSLSNCFSICCFQDKITKTEGRNKNNKEDKKKIKKDKRRKKQPKHPINPKMEYKNDNFTNKFKNLSTVFSVYWNNEKFKTSSRHKFFDENKKFKLCEQKKNFKRRKKFLNVFCFNKKEIKMEKKIIDKDQAQKFRISAYFLDQEWFKRKYEIISRKNFFENATSNPSEELMSYDNLKIKKTPPMCQMAKCTSSGMLTLPPLEDNRTPPDDYSNCNLWHNQYQSKINITKKALQRFRDRVKKKIKSKQTIIEKKYNTKCCTKECVVESKHEQHDEEYIEYYPSFMSDNESIDAVFEETENNLHDKNKQSYKCKESINPEPLYNELTRSYYDACKYSGACCSDDSRPEPAFCKWISASRVKTPFKLVKNFCVSLFGSSTEQILEETISSREKEKKVSKGVNVSPAMKSICCQHAQENAIQDNTTQFGNISPEIPQWTMQNSRHDATKDIIKRTCTCATQHCIINRNIGTWLGHHCNELHRAAKEHKRKMALEKSEETSLNTSDSSISENLTSCKSESSINSNGTKTDTTICSIATVEYREERINRKRKPRTIVVTKANRSTLTEKAKVCDVSTITNDWWSPIVERKERRDENEIFLEKKRGDFTMIERVHKRLRNKGVTTDGRIVKFKSRTQVIPPGVTDILSPSRYLLESQRYYNELFSSRFYTPHMYALNQVQRYQDNEKSRQPSIRHHTRRGHKNKKYDDSYSKITDSIKMADSPRRRLQPYSFKQNKMYRSTPRSLHGKTIKPSTKKKDAKDTEDKDVK